MANILVVDDEQSMREFLEIMLAADGYTVVSAADGGKALDLIADGNFDLVLTDLKMQGISGMDVLKAAKGHDPSVQVVMMTAYATTETAVEAMKEGAYDYITKPFKVAELKVLLSKASDLRELQKENLYLRQRLEERHRFEQLVGKSDPMQRVYNLIARVARTRTTVLVSGESGTGKELVARAIHAKSDTAKEPFVAVNCGAIPATLIESELFGHVRGAFTGATSDKKGLFQAAGRGTLFLDEVGELPLDMQVKLLRVLQERRVKRVGSTEEHDLHCRVMAATNKDLAQAVQEGAFREDLYYRLNVVEIRVPPLRERVEDIPLLAEHFLRKHIRDAGRPIRGITKAALLRLMDHPFDGNVRELENLIQRAIALAPGDMIDVDALPPRMQHDSLNEVSLLDIAAEARLPDDGIDLDRMMEQLERNLLEQALTKAHGVRKEAARLLGISFRSLRYRLDKHDIDVDQLTD